MRDYGFIQQRTIEDFDGPTWGIFFMDLQKSRTNKQTDNILSSKVHSNFLTFLHGF